MYKTNKITSLIFGLILFFSACQANAMIVADNGSYIQVSTSNNQVISASKDNRLIFDNNFTDHGRSNTNLFDYNTIASFMGWWGMSTESVLRLYGDGEYSYVVFQNGAVVYIYNHITSFSQVPTKWVPSGTSTATSTPFTGVTDGDNLIATLLYVLIIITIFGGIHNVFIGVKIKRQLYD